MRKLLNTLYVTTPEAYLSKDGLNVVISVNQTEIFRIPVINIEGIVTFGYAGASPGVMKLCADNGVSLTFLSPSGRFIGRFQGPIKGNVLLRTTQYKVAQDTERTLSISRLFIAGKIQNYRSVLRRFLRDYGSHREVEDVSTSMERSKYLALRADSAEILRGIEGDAASQYFSVFSKLIIQQKDTFVFNGRNRRPPKDAVNALLSFAYTLLTNEITSALESVGLDPYIGFFHTLRPGRPSLSLDLIEELRAYMGDRFVLSLINRRQLSGNDFHSQGEDGIIITDAGKKTVISAWQNRKKEIIEHPYLKERIPIGLIPYAQAMLLARFLRGDLDNYPVFIIK